MGTDHHINSQHHHSPTDLICGKRFEGKAAWRVGDDEGIAVEDVGAEGIEQEEAGEGAGTKGRGQGEGGEGSWHGRLRQGKEEDQAPM